MAITGYTTTADIRATLGVSEMELEDEVILSPIYATLLDEGMFDLSETLAGHFATVQEVASKSAAQRRFVNRVQAWSSAFVACKLLVSIDMFAPKTIRSEKDELDRVVDPYKNLREELPSVLNTLRQKIADSYAILFPSETVNLPDITRVLAVNVGLAIDPVTGE